MADNKTIKTQVPVFVHLPRKQHIEDSIRAIWNRPSMTINDIEYPEGPKPVPSNGFPWGIATAIEPITRS